ncbi:hypothetical protein [Actinomadura rugatobispora]|uniref:Uncharacterized protein n=1 Tax=Actinomadura rugatobispora TaxID=1994 RepID=A0ABW1A5I8_9ACTN
MEALPFVSARLEEFGEALANFGYSCVTHGITPPGPSSPLMGALVYDHVTRNDQPESLIVHVLSHGDRAPASGKLYAIGSDGTLHSATDIESWITQVEDFPNRPYTLFLLDLCYSGAVAKLPWTFREKENRRAWVIAACSEDRAAYEGHFTQALSNVLNAIRLGSLDIHKTVKHVPLETISRELKREVQRIAEAEGTYTQLVTTTMVDLSHSLDLPFFPNPSYEERELVSAEHDLDDMLLAFVDDLDEGLDAYHFLDRAAGRGPLAGRVTKGCFSGRTVELEQLGGIIRGVGPVPAISVVTGSPGVGKSALLGLIVSAAHPLLRERTRGIWEHAAPWLPVSENIAAVHVRQRGIAEVTASLFRQLQLSTLEAELTPQTLINEVVKLPSEPVIVLDALDEAHDVIRLMNELILPLSHAVNRAGRPCCRLIVGMRPWGDLSPLIRSAKRLGSLINLDQADRTRLGADISAYVSSLLSTWPALSGDESREVRDAFATTVGSTLTAQRWSEERWGEFLVASLYAYHFVTQTAFPISPGQAASLGREVPLTLPGVFELDLLIRQPDGLLRPVLAAIARARGHGMPEDLVRRVLPAFLVGAPSPAPERNATIRAIEAVRFYLRTKPDSDGTTLYRLFHQGLADHLTAFPIEDGQPAPSGLPERILELMLASLRRSSLGGYSWGTARPYLLRHAIQHAGDAGRTDDLMMDPGFLVRADPYTLFPEFDKVYSDAARNSAIAYRASVRRHRGVGWRERQQLLAIDAVRCGASELAGRLVEIKDHPVLTWLPAFAGDNETKRRPPNLGGAANTGDVYAVAIAVVEGMPRAITGNSDGTVRVWDMRTGAMVGEPLVGHVDGVRSVVSGVVNGRALAFSGGADGRICVWDLLTQAQVMEPVQAHNDWVRSMACLEQDGRLIVVSGSADQTVRVWDAETMMPRGPALEGHTNWVRGVAAVGYEGRTVAVSVSPDNTARLWYLDTVNDLQPPLTREKHAIRAVSCTKIDGRPVALTGGADGTVRVWDLRTRSQRGEAMAGHAGGVWAIACCQMNGRPTAVVGDNDGFLRIWDLRTRQLIREPLKAHSDWLGAVACIETSDGVFAATGSGDGTTLIWDLTTGTRTAGPLTTHSARTTAIASVEYEGRSLGVVCAEDGRARVWDLRAGKPVGQSWEVPGDITACDMLVEAGTPYCAIGGTGGLEVRSVGWAENELIWRSGTVSRPAVTDVRIARFDGRRFAIAVSREQGLSVFDLQHGTPEWQLKPTIGPDVRVVATTTVAGRPVAVIASTEGELATIDLIDRRERLLGIVRDREMTKVACLGAKVVVGSTDGRVGMWNLSDEVQTAELAAESGIAVCALACGVIDGIPVTVAGFANGVVSSWDLNDGRRLEDIALAGTADSLEISADGMLLIGSGWQFIGLKKRRPSAPNSRIT